MDIFKCPECEKEITEKQLTACPSCGFPLKKKKSPMQIIIVLSILLCLFFSYYNISNNKYKFYQQHYKECVDGYNESIDRGENETTYLKGDFYSIADRFEKMANEDKSVITAYRVKAIVFLTIGISITTWSYFYKKRKTGKRFGLSK